jgi:hypothetical protein
MNTAKIIPTHPQSMQQRIRYLAVAFLLAMLGARASPAQSDSQTLRSPYASLVGIAELDFGFPVGSERGYPFSLGGNLIGGFQMNRVFTLGVGVGLHGYGPSDMVLLPLFIDARLHFPQRKWTPCIALDLGYALSLDTLERGGFLFNPSFGGRVPMTDKMALGFSLGFRLQQNQAIVDGTFDDYLSNYLSLKLGLMVKLPRLSRHVFAKTISRRMRDKNRKTTGPQ